VSAATIERRPDPAGRTDPTLPDPWPDQLVVSLLTSEGRGGEEQLIAIELEAALVVDARSLVSSIWLF
jgi:hypothetical protein